LLGEELAAKLPALSLAIYRLAAGFAETKGIIIADSKFEFGLLDDRLVLIDEVLTPDSSRFWPKDDYEEGKAQRSYDKQFLRDYLISINWNQRPPAPSLPGGIIVRTKERYEEALRLLLS